MPYITSRNTEAVNAVFAIHSESAETDLSDSLMSCCPCSSASPSSSAPSIDAFNDPVLCDIMRDPVITEDGHSYERTSIETWFARGHRTSPCTGAQLSSTTLIPNHNLRIAIEEFLELHQQGRLPARSGQEEERALKLAIRVLEKRLRDVNIASRPRVGGGRSA